MFLENVSSKNISLAFAKDLQSAPHIVDAKENLFPEDVPMHQNILDDLHPCLLEMGHIYDCRQTSVSQILPSVIQECHGSLS